MVQRRVLTAMYEVLEHFKCELDNLIAEQTEPSHIAFLCKTMEKNILRKNMQ